MKAAEVTVDERVSRLGVVGSAIGRPEEPGRAVPPRVLLQEVIAAQLERRIGSLSLGHRHLVYLEQIVYDGVRWKAGPHPVGWVERASPGGVRVRLLDTEAGRTARALLEVQLLDVALSRGRPPVVRLV